MEIDRDRRKGNSIYLISDAGREVVYIVCVVLEDCDE
jgi:hypothetical protein